MQKVEITRVDLHEQRIRRPRRARVYVWPESFNVLDDMLSGRRYNRPERTLAPMVEAIVSAMAGFDVKVRWSQKAGCSCPCSPGFIVMGGPAYDVVRDISIHYKEAAGV